MIMPAVSGARGATPGNDQIAFLPVSTVLLERATLNIRLARGVR
jgi:hypothetical protein